MSSQNNHRRNDSSKKHKQDPKKPKISTSSHSSSRSHTAPKIASSSSKPEEKPLTTSSVFKRPDLTAPPTSVGNMPADLRRTIRRNQNNASSKRGRDREKVLHENLREKTRENETEIKRLEEQVAGLEGRLDHLRKSRQKKKETVLEAKGEFFEHKKFFGDPF